MDEELERRACEIFQRAYGLSPEAQRAFLREEERSSPGPVARVRTLLEAHDADADFLEDLPQWSGVSALLHSAFLTALSTPDADWPAPELRGALVGERFLLQGLLGTGRFGAVYRAEDELTGLDVAVKLLFGPEEFRELTAPRERIALLALDVPGVVRLIDSGTFEGRPFLVTEFFDGRPFPGSSDTVAWEQLVGPTVALLDVLHRMHTARVIHGDLKPENVLVGDGERVRVVDFGVAVGEAVAYTGSILDAWGGTLPYLAPELCRPGSTGPTVRSDLFAVGIMLFEALTGSVPHVCTDRDAFMRARAEEPVDLGALHHVALPAPIRRVIASLLDPDPLRRPPSAAHAADAFRGGRRSIDAVKELVESALPSAAADSADDVRSLFAGPDRLIHIRTDAALLLWRRTLGDPGEIIEELSRWIRDGYARLESGEVSLTREDLARLESLAPPEGLELRSVRDLPCPDAGPILDLVVAAGSHARVGTISDASGNSRDVTQRHLDCLVDSGLVAPEHGGSYRALFTAPGWSSTERRRHAHSALASILPDGEPERLSHLVAAGRLDELATEIAGCSARKMDVGDVTGAREAVARGLVVLRAATRPQDEEAQLVRELLEAAISEGTENALRMAVYEAERSHSAGISVRGVRMLARAALRCVRGDGAGGLALADSVRIDGADVLLELRRQSIRVFATHFLDRDTALRVVDSACAWTEEHDADERMRLASLSWRADAASRAGEYSRAIELNQEVLRVARSHHSCIVALLNSSAAALEIHELRLAHDDALQARDRARAARHSAFEARAEARLRAAQYRAGLDGPVDDELITAIRVLPDLPTRGAILLTEAATAWRREELEVASHLAAESARCWERIGVRDVADLADALAAVCHESAARKWTCKSIDTVEAYPRPGISVQIIGLRALVRGGVPPAARRLAERLAARLPNAPRSQRREVLTIEECLRFAGC